MLSALTDVVVIYIDRLFNLLNHVPWFSFDPGTRRTYGSGGFRLGLCGKLGWRVLVDLRGGRIRLYEFPRLV